MIKKRTMKECKTFKAEVIKAASEGKTIKEIAKLYNTSYNYIWNIVADSEYKFVSGRTKVINLIKTTDLSTKEIAEKLHFHEDYVWHISKPYIDSHPQYKRVRKTKYLAMKKYFEKNVPTRFIVAATGFSAGYIRNCRRRYYAENS